MKKKYTGWLFGACLFILAYIPFHAVLTTLAISNFGHAQIFKGLKDGLVALLGVFCVVLAIKSKIKLQSVEKRVLWCLVLFITLHFALMPLSDSPLQFLAGLIVNLRYFVFFGSLYLLAKLSGNKTMIDKAIRVAGISAAVVCLFGLLQVTILPKDFLRHLGYGPTTIPSYQVVDSDDSTVKILSTLRGSNSLGAYLVIVTGILAYFSTKKRKNWLLVVLGFMILALLLFNSYSRSAWLALIAGSAVFSFLYFKNSRRKILTIGCSILIACSLLVLAIRDNSFIQKAFFHSDPSESNQIDSDDLRVETLKSAVSGIVDKPLGHGVGSAGIASFQAGEAYVTENYLLEVAYQVGIIGGLLLLTIFYYVVKILFQNIDDPLSVVLLSSFIGLFVASMLWPVWSDETIAYTWWGLAGIALGKFSKNQLEL